MKPIFIIGYMAAGKTTFGRMLAKHLDCEFIDLDFYISQRFHKSIPEIFRTCGEDEFRRMEAAMLREAGEFSDVIISCGGGTPCFSDNMEYMLSKGPTVFLNASVERIMQRVRLAPGKRPLLDGKSDAELRDHIETQLAGRLPFYSQADITFGSDRLETREQIRESLDKFLADNPDIISENL